MEKPDLETCTLQEACDYAVFKIVEQGGRCIYGGGGCAYGDENGNHCAIGWLLDHDNEQLMRCGDDLNELTKVYSESIPKIIQNNLSVFNELQIFHDRAKMDGRVKSLSRLSKQVRATEPQYQQWVEMGE